MEIKERYPKLIDKIEQNGEKVFDLHNLVVVDENFDDVDSDEFDIFSPDDYNYIIYINDKVQNVIGDKGMEAIIKKLSNSKEFTNFIDNDIDNYGVKSELSEDEIAHFILDYIEGELL